MRLPSWITQHLAAFRALIVLSVLLGIIYPLAVTAIAQLPGLRANANGQLIKQGSTTVGSAIIGQSFTDKDGNALVQYFQSRPSAAGDGYDPTSTSASNLGPESVVDVLADPSVKGDTGTQSLLTQVCARSAAVGMEEGVSGARPYCAPDGNGSAFGSVLSVFYQNGSTGPITKVVSINQAAPATPFIATYKGVKVQDATFGADYSKGVITPIRGNAPATPAVPPDAVTSSASGLDPDISPDYATLQVDRVAKARDVAPATVQKLIDKYTTGRALGFMGEAGVDVLQLNLALDKQDPYHSPNS